MIRAHKSGVFAPVVAGYVTWKLRRFFRGMWARGELPREGVPRLVYLNHVNFWDGFVAHVLSQTQGWDGYCLMEEQNLARYRFLARIGAFSIRRGEGQSSLETLRYAKGLLALPRAAVFVFPEGKLTPFGPRQLTLEAGVEVLARSARAECLPIALRYAFLEHERGDILLEVGAPHPPASISEMKSRLEALVARLAEVNSLAGFAPLLQGARGVNERWDAARGARP